MVEDGTGTRDRIVDAALELAELNSWESVRLHHIASRLQISLEQIRCEFTEKEKIAEAWFDRADRAMLEFAAGVADDVPREQRIHSVMMAWFDALSLHRKPTRQMILNKLEPGHLHYQLAGAMRVSRTVQWLREAVGLEDSLPWRAFAETALTWIYLTTCLRWMFDSSDGQRDTRRYLSRQLRSARPLASLLP